MPPKSKMKDSEIAVLVDWVRQGAPWVVAETASIRSGGGKQFVISQKDREFWSFRPIADPAFR